MSTKSIQKILIVDDDPDIIKMLSHLIHYLKPKSKIYAANTQKKALELLNSHNFDLVISDYELVDGKGTKIIMHPNNNGKKIGMSGQDRPKYKEICDVFLQKPFGLNDLKKHLE